MDIMEEDKADSTTKVLVEGVIEELKTKKKSKQKQQQSKVETGEDRRGKLRPPLPHPLPSSHWRAVQMETGMFMAVSLAQSAKG